MATTSFPEDMLIGGDASDLSFTIGMLVKRLLVRDALRFAAARGAKVVAPDDIRAALLAMNWQEVHQSVGAANHGENQSRGGHAA